MVFVELPIFVRCSATLFSDAQLQALQARLLKDPLAGVLISGGHGLRKLRVPMAGRGRRAGARVIYFFWAGQERCYLVYAYAKNVATELSDAQLRRLVSVLQEEVSGGCGGL